MNNENISILAFSIFVVLTFAFAWFELWISMAIAFVAAILMIFVINHFAEKAEKTVETSVLEEVKL